MAAPPGAAGWRPARCRHAPENRSAGRPNTARPLHWEAAAQYALLRHRLEQSNQRAEEKGGQTKAGFQLDGGNRPAGAVLASRMYQAAQGCSKCQPTLPDLHVILGLRRLRQLIPCLCRQHPAALQGEGRPDERRHVRRVSTASRKRYSTWAGRSVRLGGALICCMPPAIARAWYA